MMWIHIRTVNSFLVLKTFLIKREKRSLIFIDSVVSLFLDHQNTYLGTSRLEKRDSDHLWELLCLPLSSRIWCSWNAVYILIRGCLQQDNEILGRRVCQTSPFPLRHHSHRDKDSAPLRPEQSRWCTDVSCEELSPPKEDVETPT